MAKYIAYSKDVKTWFSYKGDGLTDAELLKVISDMEPNIKWTEIKRVPRGSHVCKYCGEIAEGTYADLLCKDCRETFGHTMYSEL